MNLFQMIRKTFLIVVKHTLNHLTRRIARTSHGHFAIVQHVGRRSGKNYETPIIVAPLEDGFVIELTYGYDVDWHKNILAAGGCTIIWHGNPYTINRIEPVDTETGRGYFSPFQRTILKLLKREHFEILSFDNSLD